MKGVPQKTRPSDVAEGLYLFPSTLPTTRNPPQDAEQDQTHKTGGKIEVCKHFTILTTPCPSYRMA